MLGAVPLQLSRPIHSLYESTAVAAAGGDEAVLDARDIDEATRDQALVVDESVVAAVDAVGEVYVGDDSVAQEEPMIASQSSVDVDAADIATRVHRAQGRRAVVHVQSRKVAVSGP